MSKELVIIAGIAKNNVIGQGNKLPWHLKEDLKRFKELTFGHPMIMGRKTFESILEMLGSPLPGRTSIILTNQQSYNHPDAITTHSLDEAIKKAHEISDKAFIIGGQSIYEQALPLADKLEITHVHRNFEGDAFFPEIKGDDWLEIKRRDFEGENLGYAFSTYEKRPQAIKKNRKGMFIVVEGIDGSGKSTQIKNLAYHIFSKSKYHHIILTRNPYKNVNIRDILHQDSNPYSQAEKLADSFIADRTQQAEEIILPNLEKGHFVISDRYKLSTIIYQATQGMDMEELIEKQSHLPVPDMTFIIDVSVEEAKRRMMGEDVSIRGKEHKFEADVGFMKKLRDNLLKAKDLLSEKGEKVFVINGERIPEEITKDIADIFDRELID